MSERGERECVSECERKRDTEREIEREREMKREREKGTEASCMIFPLYACKPSTVRLLFS